MLSERIGYIFHDFIYITSVKDSTIETMSVRSWDLGKEVWKISETDKIVHIDVDRDDTTVYNC